MILNVQDWCQFKSLEVDLLATYINTEQIADSCTDKSQLKHEVKSQEETDKSKNENEPLIDGSKENEDRNEKDLRKLSQSSKESSIEEEGSLKGKDSGSETLSPTKQKLAKWDRKVC